MNDPYRSLPVIEAQVLVDYMKEITDAVEKLSGKMETLGHRVATLETNLNQPQKLLPTNSRSFKMPTYPKPVSSEKASIIKKRYPCCPTGATICHESWRCAQTCRRGET